MCTVVLRGHREVSRLAARHERLAEASEAPRLDTLGFPSGPRDPGNTKEAPRAGTTAPGGGEKADVPGRLLAGHVPDVPSDSMIGSEE